MTGLKNAKLVLAVLVSLITMASCSKEQGATGEFTKTAKIIGTYIYDQGQAPADDGYARLIKPAANIKIVVTIPAKSISGNSNATGVVTLQTVTDRKGYYEITVPVSNAGVEATVSPEDFKGKYYSVTDIIDGKPVYNEEDVVYTTGAVKINLTPDDIKINDGRYTHTALTVEEGYPYVSEFIVKTGIPTYSKKPDASGTMQVVKEYTPASGIDVVIEVSADGKEFKYVATSDTKGEAKFFIPTRKKTWSTSISVSPKRFSTKQFTFYKREKNQNTQVYEINKYIINGGYYWGNSKSVTVNFEDLEGYPTPECKVSMYFEAFEGVDTYGYTTSEWNSITF